ncbi:hypothetical protein AQI88_40635 [Streptomyces cellostaticus]|uniref:Uncharacterized protein n=2 Tax=Streptomyces cellostaticus TaxID=67285 RepID=A0A117PRF2_9ACTN|nr:hypothetical protein AQI88_40635 [Streptomyces cellostaticus]
MVYPDGHIGWIATGHELVRKALSDPKSSHGQGSVVLAANPKSPVWAGHPKSAVVGGSWRAAGAPAGTASR